MIKLFYEKTIELNFKYLHFSEFLFISIRKYTSSQTKNLSYDTMRLIHDHIRKYCGILTEPK